MTNFIKTTKKIRKIPYHIGSVLIVVIIFSSLLILPEKVAGVTYTWDGDAGDNLWSSCDNWTSNTCPGTSSLVNGEAKLFFDLSFTSLISDIVPLKVIITPTSPVQNQLYVSEKSIYGFIVKESGGFSSSTFDYLVIARRKGFEGQESNIASQSQPFVPSSTPTPNPSPTPELTHEP